MIIARPLSSQEPDLLRGREKETLVITGLSGEPLQTFPAPVENWTHDNLEALEMEVLQSAFPEGWEAHLAGEWIGSSEV
ncbi:hypothetical protein ACMV5I_28555 [Serratia sp. T13T92]|uniref:hypothetical protein n=1 Tax=Serratia TaxID=613 RepID=UPI0039DF5934